MEDIPALDGSKKEWRNVGHSTQENRRSHKPSDGSESAITVSPSCFQPLADVDEEEISDDQEDFEEGELNENTEARLKTTRKAPKVLCDRQNEALVHPSIDSFRIAAEALDRWNHLVAIEEKFYQQKSCVNWLGSPLAGRCMNVKNHRDGNCGCRLDL
ncbi:hypothetical protein HID58_038031 [Brassica napus]|uniref:Uncharacterized protein n=1 Tax=Brassica napus TaxID=3708 RepID=A0ABQ8BN37_BRANA|nr:hypothetical protein HID58_038031 [Brassica napus]